MSHYILAEVAGEEIVLTPGSSNLTIRAVLESGFDIYGEFEADELNGGWSGVGDVRSIRLEVAKNAYLNAVAWARSLEKSFPEKFNEELNRTKDYDFNISACLQNDFINEYDLTDLVQKKCENHIFMDDDSIERALMMFYGVVHFSYKMLKYAEKGEEIKMIFV